MVQTKEVRGVATSIRVEDGWTIVRYHSTDVVRFNQSTIILDTGGWNTATTQTRMNQASNQFELGYRVYRKQFTLYVKWMDKEYRLDGPTTLHLPTAQSPD